MAKVFRGTPHSRSLDKPTIPPKTRETLTMKRGGMAAIWVFRRATLLHRATEARARKIADMEGYYMIPALFTWGGIAIAGRYFAASPFA
jgi:hypothetical protein